jgi:hypothetical protein
MRFLVTVLFLGAIIGGSCIFPRSAGAQNAPAALAPLDGDPLIPAPDPSTRPTVQLPDPQTEQNDLADSPLYDCACGCGIFEVGTSSMLPMGTGLTAYFEYAYMDQNVNWKNSTSAPSANNPDKEIRTNFFTPGFQYMFDRSWGIQVEAPFANRYFQTTGGATGSDIVALQWTALGDARIEGIYAGFFPDQSLGVTFGAKLPTGNWTHNDDFDDVDRDSEIGTGSTDVLLGAFYRNNLTDSGSVGWFTQLYADLPVLFQDGYRPGAEADAALGINYNGLRIGRVGITPIAQVLNGLRGSDTGYAAANPIASGYERLILSPAVEIDMHPVMFYADVEYPVYINTVGNQLIARSLLKFIVSYHF